LPQPELPHPLLQVLSQPESQHIRRAKNFRSQSRTGCRLHSSQQSFLPQSLQDGAGQGWQHGACSAHGTYRGFFTHTVYSLHTGTRFFTQTAFISVTVYGTLTQTV
jgi:hypothetical protein